MSAEALKRVIYRLHLNSLDEVWEWCCPDCGYRPRSRSDQDQEEGRLYVQAQADTHTCQVAKRG